MLFKKKKIPVDVMEIDARYVSTGQVGEYIKNLYNNEGFRHIGYRFETRDMISRFVIYTLPDQKMVIQYFNARCPSMVEEECRKLQGEGAEWSRWPNGFEEIKC